MKFSNTDSFKASGLELQSCYDVGRVFADFSYICRLKAVTRLSQRGYARAVPLPG